MTAQHANTLVVDLRMQQFLTRDGVPSKKLPAWVDAQPEILQNAYRHMVLIRNFDQKAIALQRTGKLGTYPSILGQEAIGTAIGDAMAASDVLVPYYRDIAAQVLRGVHLRESLLYWGGDERGSAYADCPEDFPNCVPIATQFSHAAGVAAAFRIRGERRAVVVTGGDGSTSKGDFLESLNVAGAWQLPLVMVVNNNQWAISTPREVQTASQTIAQKAVAGGIPGVQVDGNDYIAMRQAMSVALERAHAGKGATLIEAISYRLGDHTTADDATRYRSQEELREAWEEDPLKRLRNYLISVGSWSEDQERECQLASKARIEAAVADYLDTSAEPPGSMFDHLFSELPSGLRAQRAECELRSQTLSGGAS